MSQAFTYHPTDQQEYLEPYPAGPITDDWLAERATVTGQSVAEMAAEIATLLRADGKPLYTATAKGKAALSDADAAPAAKPRVPLGTKPGE